jgi:hypothetical protein
MNVSAGRLNKTDLFHFQKKTSCLNKKVY